MPPTFGTSGLRGLVTELTDDLVTDYVRAFATALPVGAGVAVGWDLRPSSPRIAQASIAALRDLGLRVQEAGALPTPALAFGAMAQGMGAVMITGSHIPADRNGLKFYTPEGEILKADEARIQAALPAVPCALPPVSLHSNHLPLTDDAVSGWDMSRSAYIAATVWAPLPTMVYAAPLCVICA